MSEERIRYGRDRSPRALAFLAELAEVCRRHGLSLSHEDRHGAFEVAAYDERNTAWLLEAHDNTGGEGTTGSAIRAIADLLPPSEEAPEIAWRLSALTTAFGARRWLDASNQALGGETPRALMEGGEGGRLLDLLTRLEEGVTT